MSFSVIIPTRDTRELTLRCLAALAGSDEPPAEILLVDDGSRDGTAEEVRAAYPAVRIVARETSGGFTAAVNAAWPLAAGEIVLLLNSDTEVNPQATRGFAAAFAGDSSLGIAGASLWYPDGRPQWSAGPEPTARWLFALTSGAAAALGRVPGWRRVRRESQAGADAAWVPATAMAIRREVTAAIGVFDPAFRTYAQDLDYCMRARAAGWRVAQLADVHVLHVLGATIGRVVDGVASGAEVVESSGVTAPRQDPQALVTDLARAIRKAHAPAIAQQRCSALAAGLRVRLIARRLRRWTLPPHLRVGWDRDTDRYRAALRALLKSGA